VTVAMAIIFLYISIAVMFTGTFVWGQLYALLAGLPFFVIGLFIIFRGSKKKEQNRKDDARSLNNSYPLFCPRCGVGYDKSWKVCLNCEERLVENKNYVVHKQKGASRE